MENKNRIWNRKPQEQQGDYYFEGTMYATKTVASTLTKKEMSNIVSDLFTFVKQNEGADYLQVYESNDGLKIFCIDQLSRSMLTGNGYTEQQKKEYNYWTMLFAEEY